MGANKILRVECDHKGCGKILLIPDPPLKPTAGADKIWSLTSAASNTIYWFCCAHHALAFLVAWIKATPEETVEIEKPKTILDETQLKTLKEMGIIVEAGAMEEIPLLVNLDLSD